MNNIRFIAIVVAITIVVSLTSGRPVGSDSYDNTQVMTDKGMVIGVNATNGSRKWLGIPFAAPPINDLRFAPPVEAETWLDPLVTDAIAPMCINIVGVVPIYPASEDCLYLNVYASGAADPQGRLLPVMIWIYGGGFFIGDSYNFGMYDGEYIVSTREVILVTLNYRLGPFGFLVLDGGIVGNMGILDQRFAMEWVQRNIAAFGGDPNQVTIFGESAGAMSVGFHLVSEPSWNGLFQHAIMESNTGLYYKSEPEALSMGRELAAKCGCENLTTAAACMRALPARQVWRFTGMRFDFGRILVDCLTWGPIVDNVNLLGQPYNEFMRGHVADNVEIIVGNNRDETVMMSQFVDLPLGIVGGITGRDLQVPMYTNEYIDAINSIWKDKADLVLARYPPLAGNANNWRMLIDFIQFYLWECPSRLMALGARNHGNTVYAYTFTHVPQFMRGPEFGEDWQGCRTKYVCHAVELVYVFHTAKLNGLINIADRFTDEEEILSQTMINKWVGLASGNINGITSDPTWPQYNGTFGGETRYVFDTYTRFTDTYNTDTCEFWDAIGYIY